MPGRARRARKRSSRRQARKRSWRRRWTLRLLLAGMVAMLLFAGVSYLQVRRAFSHRLWQHASRIYSEGLLLSPGLLLAPGDLLSELASRGYSAVADPPGRQGQYRQRDDVIEVYLRSFDYGHGEVRGYPVRVRFSAGRIAGLELGATGDELEVAVLEPRPLGAFYGDLREARTIVELDAVPRVLLQAIVELEDRRFLRHWGLDFRGMARALVADLRSGELIQGGSTITQQVIKNVLLTHERTVVRKVREVVMAPMLESLLGKEEILRIYVNEIYLGQKGPVSIAGVGEAARFYFGREPRDLDLAQSALLAGLIRSPGTYNPWVHPQVARRRRAQVLEVLVARGVIEASAAELAAAQPLRLADATGGDLAEGAYFLELVREQLRREFGAGVLRQEGLRVLTTLDTRIQRAATRALREGLEALDSLPAITRRRGEGGGPQGAVVVMNPQTGAVLGLVGGRDYKQTPFNRAVRARRQVGSLFKPFVYAAAFQAAGEGRDGGLNPASILEDAPLRVSLPGGDWEPANNDGRFRGAMTVRQALAQSVNLPAVRAALGVGIGEVADMAVACGFPAQIPRVPALALGSAEATPLQVATAFSTLAGGGRRPVAHAVKRILDRNGMTVAEGGSSSRRVMGAGTAYLVVNLMQEVVRSGTARRLTQEGFTGALAGKTGTTNDRRDAWFVGFNPDTLAVTWVGFDDNRPLGLEGSQAALPIWAGLARQLDIGGRSPFTVPGDIEFHHIDPATGGVATRRCPSTVEEAFLAHAPPGEICSEHRREGFWRRLFRR